MCCQTLAFNSAFPNLVSSMLSIRISSICNDSSLWIFFLKASLEKEHYSMQVKDVPYITNDLIICWLQIHICHSVHRGINLMPKHLLFPTYGLYHSCSSVTINIVWKSPQYLQSGGLHIISEESGILSKRLELWLLLVTGENSSLIAFHTFRMWSWW